jgi:hypothetical protein
VNGVLSSALRNIAWGRVLLAVAALIFSFLAPLHSPWVLRVLAGVFFLYTLLVALRGRALSGMLGMVALFADVAFFLSLASLASNEVVWLAAVFFLYLITEALVFYTAMELVVIAGVCAIFCVALPFPRRPCSWQALWLAASRSSSSGRSASSMPSASAWPCPRRPWIRPSRRSGSASLRISTMGRCRASSACKCGSRSCVS